MTRKTSTRYSPEVRARAVRMVQEHRGDHASKRAALGLISAKIGCAAERLAAPALHHQRSSCICRTVSPSLAADGGGGPFLSDPGASMVTSYRAGRVDDSVPGAFPVVAKADGEPGPNSCRLVQVAIIPPEGI